MKKQSDNRPERQYNPPAVVLARGAFLLLAVSIPLSGFLLLGGALGHDLKRLALGFVAGIIAACVYGWLRRKDLLTELIASVNWFDADPPPDSGTDFTNLVRAWEDLSSKRGTPEFDPWRLLNLRREIEAKTKNDPTLADYWRDHIR